jgi:hypothetical protein
LAGSAHARVSSAWNGRPSEWQTTGHGRQQDRPFGVADNRTGRQQDRPFGVFGSADCS